MIKLNPLCSDKRIGSLLWSALDRLWEGGSLFERNDRRVTWKHTPKDWGAATLRLQKILGRVAIWFLAQNENHSGGGVLLVCHQDDQCRETTSRLHGASIANGYGIGPYHGWAGQVR